MNDWITAQQAAAELGLSPSTLKRFCDVHEIPIARTPGGHRRIDRSHMAQVASLMRCQGKSLMAAEYPDTSQIVKLLLAGDHSQLTDLIWAATPSMSELVARLEDFFVPALWQIGSLWHKKEIEIAHEKVATYAASMVLNALVSRMPAPAPSARLLLGATFPTSADTIGLKIVAIGLRSVGVQFIHLGSGISPDVIARAAVLYHASAVCISHTHVVDLDDVARNHHRLAELLPEGCKVIVGGGGLSPMARRQFGPCEYFESIQQLVQREELPVSSTPSLMSK